MAISRRRCAEMGRAHALGVGLGVGRGETVQLGKIRLLTRVSGETVCVCVWRRGRGQDRGPGRSRVALLGVEHKSPRGR